MRCRYELRRGAVLAGASIELAQADGHFHFRGRSLPSWELGEWRVGGDGAVVGAGEEFGAVGADYGGFG